MGKQQHLSITETWFNTYFAALLAYGMGRCKNMVLVEDSVIDVFEKIHRMEDDSPSLLTEINEPLVYLRVALRHKIIDNLKKESSMLGWEEVQEEPAVYIPPSEEYCRGKREELKVLLRFFEKLGLLPEPMQEILALKAQGYSGREIEEMLQLTSGYSDTLFSRFKNKVKKYMKK